jgi:hypothetical protein
MKLDPRWLPIETAPKDGDYVVILAPGCTDERPVLIDVCSYDDGYWWNRSGHPAFNHTAIKPTHWIKLPL